MKTSLSPRWRLSSNGNMVMSSPFDLVSRSHAWDLSRSPLVLVLELKNHEKVLQSNVREEERRDKHSSDGD